MEQPKIAMTMEQLKAHAYDVLAQIESLQRELQATNNAISEKAKEEASKPVEEQTTIEEIAEN